MNSNNLFNDEERIRRDMGEKSLQAFAELYFPHYLKTESCSFHDELYEMLDRITIDGNGRVAIAAPRGAARAP